MSSVSKVSNEAHEAGAEQCLVTVADIQARAADFFGVTVADLKSQWRVRRFARPRQVAMYLARQMTPRSFSEIGRLFGGRDHTTIIHGCRVVEMLMEADIVFHAQVELLRLRVGRGSGERIAA